MKTNSEDHIEKIKRLLALSEHNSNPNEAAAALSRAQKLMKRFGINQEDLDLSEIGELKKEIYNGLKDKNLIEGIAAICAKAFGLEALFVTAGRALCSIKFIGPKDKLSIVSYIFDFLSRQTLNAKAEYQSNCKKLVDQEALRWIEYVMPEGDELRNLCLSLGISPKSYAYKRLKLNAKLKTMVKSYLIGYLMAIHSQVQKFEDKRTSNLIRLHLDKYHPEIGDFNTKQPSIDIESWAQGSQDGENVNLLRPLSGEESFHLPLNN